MWCRHTTTVSRTDVGWVWGRYDVCEQSPKTERFFASWLFHLQVVCCGTGILVQGNQGKPNAHTDEPDMRGAETFTQSLFTVCTFMDFAPVDQPRNALPMHCGIFVIG